jgi:hypothetical protein
MSQSNTVIFTVEELPTSLLYIGNGIFIESNIEVLNGVR